MAHILSGPVAFCRVPVPMVSHNNNHPSPPFFVSLKVEEAKFGTSARLASLGVDAFFLEMDCWLLRDPRPLFFARSHKIPQICQEHYLLSLKSLF